MLPDLSFLIALLLGLYHLGGAPRDPAIAFVGSLLCLLVGGALSRLAVGRAFRAVEEQGDLLLADAAGRWATLWPLVAWIAALVFFDWGAWVNVTVPRVAWLTREAVLFLPAMVVFAVGWGGRAQVEALLLARRGGVPPPAPAWFGVRRALRRNALMLLPLFLLIGAMEAVWVGGELGVPWMRDAALWLEAMPLLSLGAMFLLTMLALPFVPGIFARALKARTLAPGGLRARLERAAGLIGLGYRDILVWPTGGRGFNAMVVGFTHGTRRIFLTDGLLDALPEDETLAVFFHEAGHAKRNHLPQFVLLFFAVALVFTALRIPLAEAGLPLQVQVLLHFGIIWFVLLGWVSRRFERDADVFGAEHAAILDPDAPPVPLPGLPLAVPRGAGLMILALERIRAIVGRGTSHRHGSVAERIAFLAAYASDPETRHAHRRGRRALTWGILAIAGVAVALATLRWPVERAHARALVLGSEAIDAYEEARRLDRSRSAREAQGAVARYRESRRLFLEAAAVVAARDDATSHAIIVRNTFNAADVALRGLDDPEAARQGFRTVLDLLERRPLPGAPSAVLRFEAHVDLGRLAAWAAVGEDPDLGPVLEHREAARTIRRQELAHADEDIGSLELYDERLRLLQATYEGARGEVAEARRALEKLTSLGTSRRGDPERRREIADDAARELERLARLHPQDD